MFVRMRVGRMLLLPLLEFPHSPPQPIYLGRGRRNVPKSGWRRVSCATATIVTKNALQPKLPAVVTRRANVALDFRPAASVACPSDLGPAAGLTAGLRGG